MRYLQLLTATDLPDIAYLKPFRCVVVVEEIVSADWQSMVSDWLVESGGLYMMAWGRNSSSWDDSVDISNLKKWNYKDIPEESFVVTTWHENDSLKDVFEFSKMNAFHSTIDIENTIVIHISKRNKMDEYEGLYKCV